MSPDRGLQDPRFYHSAVLLRDLEGPVDRGSQIVTAEDNDCHGITSRSVGGVVVLEYALHLLVNPEG